MYNKLNFKFTGFLYSYTYFNNLTKPVIGYIMKIKKLENSQPSVEKTGKVDSDKKIKDRKFLSLPKFGSFVVGKIEFPDLQGLTPFSPSAELMPIYKNQKDMKYAKARRNNLNFISAKKIQPKKRNWKKSVFNLAAAVVLGVVTGSLVGGWYKDYTESLMKIDYPESAEPYLDNTDSIVSKIQANGGSPLNYTLSENFAMASYKAAQADSFYFVGRGKVATIATQSVFSIRAFDGETYELTSQSVGMMTVAVCAVHKKGSGNVNLIKGKNVKAETADWTGENQKFTTEQFIDKNGSLPEMVSPYVVSSQTVLNNTDTIEETTLNDKKAYLFTLKIDPVLGAIRYHKQVMLTSGLTSKPKFDDISIKVYLDENWNFLRTEILEHYTVKYGIPAPCEGTLNTDYTFNEPVTLPYKPN